MNLDLQPIPKFTESIANLDSGLQTKHFCKNCGSGFLPHYRHCPYCGQKTSTDRLTLRVVFNELSSNFLQVDHGLFRTLIDLTLRPTKAIEDYLKGRRVAFLGPAKFFLLGFLIFSISNYFLMQELHLRQTVQEALKKLDHHIATKGVIVEGDFSFDLGKRLHLETTAGSTHLKIKLDAKEVQVPWSRLSDLVRVWVPEFSISFKKYFQLSFLFWLPLSSILGFIWLRKRKRNLAEHQVVHLFLFGQFMFVLAVISAIDILFIRFGLSQAGLLIFLFLAFLHYWRVAAVVLQGRRFRDFLASLTVGFFGVVLFASQFAGFVLLALQESLIEVIRSSL